VIIISEYCGTTKETVTKALCQVGLETRSVFVVYNSADDGLWEMRGDA
jgi:hypothetical protein